MTSKRKSSENDNNNDINDNNINFIKMLQSGEVCSKPHRAFASVTISHRFCNMHLTHQYDTYDPSKNMVLVVYQSSLAASFQHMHDSCFVGVNLHIWEALQKWTDWGEGQAWVLASLLQHPSYVWEEKYILIFIKNIKLMCGLYTNVPLINKWVLGTGTSYIKKIISWGFYTNMSMISKWNEVMVFIQRQSTTINIQLNGMKLSSLQLGKISL